MAHAPVKILSFGFQQSDGQLRVLDGALEPVLSTALEGRHSSRHTIAATRARRFLSSPGSTQLDENSARLIAQREGVGVVVTGSIRRDGSKYAVSVQAIDPAANKVIDGEKATASTPNDLNRAVVRIAAGVRKALGDVSPQSVETRRRGDFFLAIARSFSAIRARAGAAMARKVG